MRVVEHFVAPKNSRATDSFDAAKLVKAVAAGLPVSELLTLQKSLDVSSEELAQIVGISKATLHRHKDARAKLTPAVSDRIVRYARILGKATQIFGDLADAKRWLNSPQFGLGGSIPMDYAKTELGAREVENLLGRIEHGVYS